MARPQKSKPILRYGYRFPPDADDLDIELSAIRHLGHWTDGERQCGNGLAFHVKRAIQLIWPPPEGGFPPEPGQIYWHRWGDLMITEMCKEGRLAIYGPSSSSKSITFVLFALVMFYAHPDGTSVVISSTTLDALQSRIWGYVVEYHKYAKKRYEWLPGSLIESRQKLLADPSDAEARSFKNGIVGVALKKGGQWQGLAEFVGRKNEVMIVGCDELSFCPGGVTDSLANLESNEHCFACFMGNLPNIYNPLAKAAEPKEGWESFPETEKSRVYQTRWKNGRAIQLIGMDSPNLDYPEGAEPFKGLIGRRYIEQQAYNYGRDSDMFNMFASGKLPKASMNRVAVPRHLCLKFHAMERAVWGHHKLTIGYAMDVAYSGLGGDRTVGVPFMFGKDNVGAWRFMLGPMKLYAGSSTKEVSHAEAIARDVRAECEAHGVLPEHFFYDGTGRSEFTIALGRTWSTAVVPIEFGGPATERICFTGERHFGNDRDGEPKTCREVFDRFVTELWFAIRECVAADQARGFSEELVEELNGRLFEIVRGSKYSIEPKDGEKEGRPVGMKARGLRSPDYSDCTATALEGARRLGFPLGKAAMAKSRQDDRWLDSLRDDDWKRANEDALTT